ncbi:MAG TPA: M1 family aminopeptidase [Chthonomonadaceae bacterium]|nr:M1 family aminopeptidase [Chthonomonadaceae bacterium]
MAAMVGRDGLCGRGGADGPLRRRPGAGWRSLVAGLAIVLLLAVAEGRGSEQAVQRSVPRQVSALLELALDAVNRRSARDVAVLSVDLPDAFRWVETSGHPWRADALPIPGADSGPSGFLLVFHSYHTCESDGDHVYRVVVPNSGEWRIGPEIPETETFDLRIRDHMMNAVLSLQRKLLTVRDLVSLERARTGDRDGRIDYGILRLNEDYRLASLYDPGTGLPVPYAQAGGVVVFAPPAAERFQLAMEYSGSPNHSNGDFIHPDEAVLASYWYPNIARLPASLTLTATAPIGWTAVAQGEPGPTRINGDGTATTTWRNTIPVSYFTLDMGKYREFQRKWRGRTLYAYMLDPKASVAERTARDSLDRLEASLGFFESSFGPYPYSRYAIVETNGPFNGALEAYSFATFGPRTLPEYVPHELSHTWWGGLVPCTYTTSMWNEAFANYSDDLFQRSHDSGAVGQQAVQAGIARRRAERKRSETSYGNLPIVAVADTENEAENAVGYLKGAQVLRMLEDEIGQAPMIASMRAFAAGHRRGEAADWQEFESVAARTTGKDLHWFFDEWLTRPGAARLGIADVSAHRDGAEYQITGRIRQSGELYRLKLPIVATAKSGAVARIVLDVADRDTPFSITMSRAPDRIEIDPEAIVPLAVPAWTCSPKVAFTYEFP